MRHIGGVDTSLTSTGIAAHETWLPVPGWTGYYEVSDHGNVRSLQAQRGPRREPKCLKPRPSRNGRYLAVCLKSNGAWANWCIHQLVTLAFIGPPPLDEEVRHLDGNAHNNHISNLAYGTHSENLQDAVRHGTHYQASKTRCPAGHKYTLTPRQRRCQQCESRSR